MKAFLKHHRQSPRKVRLVASLIRGKQVDQALQNLKFIPKRAAKPLEKLLASAIANATNTFGVPREALFVDDVRVDEGTVMKRYMPKAFGRASVIKKRSSRILITLRSKVADQAKAARTSVSAKRAREKAA